MALRARSARFGLVLSAVVAGCGPASKRDLSRVPQRQISFDDQCRLQPYFDQRNASAAQPFRVIDETQSTLELTLEDDDGRPRTRTIEVGSGEYELSDRPARRRLQQLVDEEYDNVPDLGLLQRGAHVRVRVRYWVSSTMRRLIPSDTITIVGPRATATLPFNPCVGEFLFGAQVYGMRRRFIDDSNARATGRVAPSEVQALAANNANDAGAASIGASDASDASDASSASDAGEAGR